jgi:hypothetical protein
MHKTFSKTKSSASKKDNTWQQTHQKQKRDKQNNTHTQRTTVLMRQSIKQAKPNKQTNKQATKAWAMCL